MGDQSHFDRADRAKCVLPQFWSIGCVSSPLFILNFSNWFWKIQHFLNSKYFEFFKIIWIFQNILNFSNYFEFFKIFWRQTDRQDLPIYVTCRDLKSQKVPQNLINIERRIEENTENNSCLFIWLAPKYVFEPYPTPL